jgi:hypothetical protein
VFGEQGSRDCDGKWKQQSSEQDAQQQQQRSELERMGIQLIQFLDFEWNHFVA